jgi:hypothetical protein
MFKRLSCDNNGDMELNGHVFFLLHLRIEVADISTRPDRNAHDALNPGFKHRDTRSVRGEFLMSNSGDNMSVQSLKSLEWLEVFNKGKLIGIRR